MSSAWHTQAAPSPLIRRAMGLPAIILVVVLLVLDPFNSKEGPVGAQEGFQFETYVSKPIRPNQSNSAHGVVELADGGLLVLANVFDAAGPAEWPLLVKTDSNGKMQWQREVGQDVRDASFHRGIPTSDNGAILVGSARGHYGDAATGWIVRIDAGGSIRWQHFVKEAWTTRLMGIQATSDGGAIIGGRLRQGNTEDSALLVRLDRFGTPVWTKRYGRSQGTWADLVLTRRRGGFVVSNSVNNPWLAGYSDSGMLLWEHGKNELGGVLRLSGLAEAPDGTLLLAGEQGATGSESIFLLRLSPDARLLGKRQFGQSRFCGVRGFWFAGGDRVQAVGPTCSSIGKRMWAATLSVTTGTVLAEREFVSDSEVQLEYALGTRAGGFVAVGWFLPPRRGAWLATARF